MTFNMGGNHSMLINAMAWMGKMLVPVRRPTVIEGCLGCSSQQKELNRRCEPSRNPPTIQCLPLSIGHQDDRSGWWRRLGIKSAKKNLTAAVTIARFK
jgi:hypothetical protein